VARHRADFDCNPLLLQMRNRAFDRAGPDKADVAISGLHRQPRHRVRRKSRSVTIQLYVTEPVRISLAAFDHFHAEDARVKIVRSLPVRNMDDAVIKSDRHVYGQLNPARA
jgi:hypothetical protein